MNDTEAPRSRTDVLRSNRQFWALVGVDTFDPIVERVQALLSHDRRIVSIERYVNKTGADNLDIHTGLRLDSEYGDPFEVRTWSDGGKSFTAHLAPGITGIGFATRGARTEAQMRAVYGQAGEVYDQPVTRIRLDGWPNDPSRDDRIDIEHWNEHRVCRLTTLTFQADWG